MYVYSASIEIPAGRKLAGFASNVDKPTTAVGRLDVHGIGSLGSGGWDLCSVDALYPGVLASLPIASGQRRVFAASHTHYAPMLDDKKPLLGAFCAATAADFTRAITNARRLEVAPTTCLVFRGEASLPVYRRFDYPASTLNKILTRHAGMYPNDAHQLDRGVYIFIFCREDIVEFAFVYHACHPVTRHDSQVTSADYPGILRDAVAARFGTTHCLFFQGCAGDVRPGFAEKRIAWLPRTRLNWRFRGVPTQCDQNLADSQYREAVLGAIQVAEFAVPENFRLETQQIPITGYGIAEVPRLYVSDLVKFDFVPFEVSHRYHLESFVEKVLPSQFVVSCSGETRGYLPHFNQIDFCGYEVDGSRQFMGSVARTWMNGDKLK